MILSYLRRVCYYHYHYYRVINNDFLLRVYYVPSSAQVYKYWLY